MSDTNGSAERVEVSQEPDAGFVTRPAAIGKGSPLNRLPKASRDAILAMAPSRAIDGYVDGLVLGGVDASSSQRSKAKAIGTKANADERSFCDRILRTGGTIREGTRKSLPEHVRSAFGAVGVIVTDEQHALGMAGFEEARSAYIAHEEQRVLKYVAL